MALSKLGVSGLNIDELKSYLSRMSPQQRQQVAAQYKNSPYASIVIPLAMGITQEEQRMSQGLQAQQQAGQQEQPKVVDEVLAQMAPRQQQPQQQQLPENQGIARLPAQNIAQMADGGIAGYDDTEPVERYQDRGLTGAPQFIQDLLAIPGAYEEWWKRQREEDARKAALEKESAEKRRATLASQGKASFFNYLFGSPQREAEGKAELAAAAAAASGAAPSSAAPSRASTPSIEGELDPTTGRAMTPSATAPVAPPGPPAPRPPAATPGAGLPAALDVKKLYDSLQPKEPGKDPFEARRREISEAEVKAAQDELAEFERVTKERGPAFADREARLKKQEAKLGERESRVSKDALIEAGFAMMAGESPNAFKNIAQGALVGTRTYRQGVKEIEEGREKLDDAFSRIEEFRRNESMMDTKERRALKKDIRTAQTAGIKSLLDGAEKAYGLDRDAAKTMFAGAIQVYNQQVQTAGTLGAARIKADSDQSYINAIRGAQAVETARKNTMAEVIKSMPYETDQTKIQAEFERRWADTLRRNPNLVEFGGATGGGGASAVTVPPNVKVRQVGS